MLQIKIKFRLKFFNLQYLSQIVETDTVSCEFSPDFLTFTHRTFVLTQMYPPPSPMLSHALFWSTGTMVTPNQHWGRGNAHKCFKIFDEYYRIILNFYCLLILIMHIIRVRRQRKLRMNLGYKILT